MWRAAFAGGALGLCSCQAAPPQDCAARSTTAALTNATSRAEYLGLGLAEESAVARILVQPGSSTDTLCSGLLIGARSVLTAAHCLEANPFGQFAVAFGPDAEGRRFETPAVSTVVHPQADAMVLSLEGAPSEAMDVVSLSVARALPPGFTAGSLVQLAGYGEDENAKVGEREFLVESVLELGDDTVVVGSAGYGGACFGDSGGPLLVRDAGGAAVTIGILGRGSVGCFGRDTFTRVDRLAAWLNGLGLARPEDKAAADPSELPSEGRCFGEVAAWRDRDEVEARACTAGQRCGYDVTAAGYRCLMPEADPCEGISDLGMCEDEGASVRCVNGRVVREECAACGMGCVRSPKTGVTACRALP